MLTIGSLFSGIGGLELGLEWAGLGPVIWQVERDAFCRAVLAKHYPEAKRFDDVCTVGAAELGPVDLICGGFPCQDVSSAGKGAGLAGERSGLWSEFARIVAELHPGWVVVENVISGASRWFDEVVRQLEQLRYAVLPVPVAASDVGAPHRRARLFIVAHAYGSDRRRGAHDSGPFSWRGEPQGRSVSGMATDADGVAPGSNQGSPRLQASAHGGWSSQPGLVPVVHGLPGRLAGRRRHARVRSLGNAVVPQCGEVVGYVIRELIASQQRIA